MELLKCQFILRENKKNKVEKDQSQEFWIVCSRVGVGEKDKEKILIREITFV